MDITWRTYHQKGPWKQSNTLLSQTKSSGLQLYRFAQLRCSTFNEFPLKAGQWSRQKRIWKWMRPAVLRGVYNPVPTWLLYLHTCTMLLSPTAILLWVFHWPSFTSGCFPFLWCPHPPNSTCTGHWRLLFLLPWLVLRNSGQSGIKRGHYSLPAPCHTVALYHLPFTVSLHGAKLLLLFSCLQSLNVFILNVYKSNTRFL